MTRSKSPIVKYNKRKAPILILDDEKIHRIRLISDAVCTVANVVSPNCIWFKLKNHVTMNLRCIRPSVLEKLQSSINESTENVPQIQINSYVMAPMGNGDVYVRGRVLDIKSTINHGDFAYIFYIDDGTGCWVHVSCLAKMETILYTHPWQVIPVALFKVFPGLELNSLTSVNNWPEKVTHLLNKILSEYQFFRVVPIHDSRRPNDYSDHIRADVFGLFDEDNMEGDSIAHRLSLEMFPSINSENFEIDFLHRGWCDAAEQRLMPSTHEPFLEKMIDSMERWRLEFPNDFSNGIERLVGNTSIKSKKILSEESENESEEDNSEQLRLEWDADAVENIYPFVTTPSIQYLIRNSYYVNEKFRICVEWKSLSPLEFYAFPLPKSENCLHTLYEETLKWSAVLDSFYGRFSNRIPINHVIVKDMLRSNQPIYAIYEYNDEFISGSYRRIQVLAVRNPKSSNYSNEFCRIRFLDVGGSDIVPLAGLITIHSSHCKRPPMCLQLSVRGRENNILMDAKVCRMFRKLLRSDMPIECSIIRQVPSNTKVLYGTPSHIWPDVFEVKNLCVNGTNTSIEEKIWKETNGA